MVAEVGGEVANTGVADDEEAEKEEDEFEGRRDGVEEERVAAIAEARAGELASWSGWDKVWFGKREVESRGRLAIVVVVDEGDGEAETVSGDEATAASCDHIALSTSCRMD